MGSKQKEVKLKDLLPVINYCGDPINDSNVLFVPKDCSYYMRMKHLALNRDIFVRADDAFAIINLIQKLNSHINETHIFDDKIKSLINDIVVMSKKIDTYNDIIHDYRIVVKNKKIYIL